MGLEEEIQEIEDEIAETPKNKATEQHLGRLKAKLSKLKEELQEQGSAGGGGGYAPPKTGDATVVLVGYPSVGKSTLLNALTNADSEVGSYEFTTLDVVPGMIDLDGANVQILDVPGLIGGAGHGRGRGREVLSVVRTADLVALVADVFSPGQIANIEDELYEVGIRIDQEPPKVKFDERGKGGIEIRTTVDLDIDEDTLKTILRENGFLNGYVTIRENVTVDRFIDALSDNRVYLPSITVFNKADLANTEILQNLKEDFDNPVFISAEKKQNLDELKQTISENLNLIRIYMKPRNGDPDYEEPLILRKGATVEDAATKIHRDKADKMRWARIWGPSAKHEGQQVGTDHELKDGDVLTIVD